METWAIARSDDNFCYQYKVEQLKVGIFGVRDGLLENFTNYKKNIAILDEKKGCEGYHVI